MRIGRAVQGMPQNAPGILCAFPESAELRADIRAFLLRVYAAPPQADLPQLQVLAVSGRRAAYHLIHWGGAVFGSWESRSKNFIMTSYISDNDKKVNY